jgi:hypothetical protein
MASNYRPKRRSGSQDTARDKVPTKSKGTTRTRGTQTRRRR